MQEDRIAFDLELIPESERMQLVAIAYEAAKEYMKQPGIQEKYEQWLKQRETKRFINQNAK